MTREEALELAPAEYHQQLRTASGSDGERWYWAQRNPRDDSTVWVYDSNHGVETLEAELDPPGTDWVPGRFNPPEHYPKQRSWRS